MRLRYSRSRVSLGSLRRSRRLMRWVVAAAGLGVLGPPLWPLAEAEAKPRGDEAQAEEVDHLALAARLFKDGHVDRAETVLRQIDVSAEGVDLPRLYTLQGLVFLKQGAHEKAIGSFERAVGAGQAEPVIHLYLAQSHFALKDHVRTLEALAKAGPAGADVPGTFFMRSQSHWELGQHDAAFGALEEGLKVFPDQSELSRIKLVYLIELGLFQEVSRIGQAYLERPGATAEDHAAVGEGLRQSKQLAQARSVLEAAHLRFPEDEKINVLLAHTYLDEGRPLVAALLFEDAARRWPKYSLEAAELYLEAGRHERALFNNTRVLDSAAKLKQRLAILLKQEQFNLVIGMAPSLVRLELTADQNIRYALAYAHFKVGELDGAEAHLEQISEPRLFESTLQLRKAMATCKEAGWECF